MISEQLLHFVWQHRLYQAGTGGLLTACGRRLEVRHPGRPNAAQGPDFLDADIVLDGVRLYGSVELHLHTADWQTHGHHIDPVYNTVVLHASLAASPAPILRQDGTEVPQLALEPLLPRDLLHRHAQLVQNLLPVPCVQLASTVRPLTIRSWLAACGTARMEAKARLLETQWLAAGQDWEQLLWQELAAAFGAKQNQEPFRLLAARLPLRVLRQHAANPLATQALIFGMSGFLNTDNPDAANPYVMALAQEWQHLCHLHGLVPLPQASFHFLRMRPQNFPTLRLAQLAALIQQLHPIGQLLRAPGSLHHLSSGLTLNPYWHHHYSWGRRTAARTGHLPGPAFWNTVTANALVPLALFYRMQTGNGPEPAELLEPLERLPPEDDKITRLYSQWPVQPATLLESQALHHLYRRYCEPHRCLECAIGSSVLMKRGETD